MFYYRPPNGQLQPLSGTHTIITGAGADAYRRLDDVSARLHAIKTRIVDTTASLKPAISGSDEVFVGPKAGFYATQGGGTDGTHYFYYQFNNNTSPGNLVKVDMATFTEVGRVSLSLGHGNDMTYCPDDGLLYVCGGQGDPEAWKVYKITPDTLQLVETVTLPEPIYSIAYDRVNRRFFGIGYNRVFRIFDEHLNMQPYSPDPNKSPSPCIADGWTSQGSECDNLFIYHCWSNGSSSNRIEIFDWDANYLGYAAFSASGEIEHCFRVGNFLYVGFWQSSDGTVHLYKCNAR